MGKTKIISLILFGIFLVGCSQNVEEDLPKEPPEETNTELGNPPTVGLISGVHSITGTVDKYCWEEEGKSCALEATSPRELLQATAGYQRIRLEQGGKIIFSLSSPYPSSYATELLQPDKIEVIQYKEDETSTFVVKNKEFLAPNEKGVYYYSAILTFDDDIKGEAIYAFSIYVR